MPTDASQRAPRPRPVHRLWLTRAASLCTSLGLGLALAAGVLLAARPQVARAAPNVLSFPGCGVTIQACINSAAPGDTINIAAGVYIASLTLNQAVSLVGAGSGSTFIQAQGGQRVITVTAAMTTATQISDMTLQNGSAGAGQGGGILLAAGAQPLLQNLIVSSNSAASGGGLYANSPLVLNNVTVFGNLATNGNGGGLLALGAVTATNSTFQNNTVITNGSGGGAAAYGNFTGLNVNFISNAATGATEGNGGGLQVYGALTLTGGQFNYNRTTLTKFYGGGGGLIAFSTISITGTQFLSNTTADWGGGAYLADFSPSAHSVLTNALFISNTAQSGGGGGMFMWYTATLNTVSFYSNTSAHNGGGAYAGYAGNYRTIFQGGTFVSNTTTGGVGGGLYSDSNLSVTGTQFLSNVARIGTGGGLQGAAVSLTNTMFTGNSATYGGAIQANSLSLLNSLVQRNSSTFNGGGVSSPGSVAIESSQFISNTTGGDGLLGGGAVAANQALTASNSSFIGNQANSSAGGALVTRQQLSVYNSLFSGNTAVTGPGGAAAAFNGATIWLGTFSSNQGLQGGALAITGTINLSQSAVSGNFANSTGGGLYLGAGDGLIANVLFASNTALSAANQLYLAPTATLQIRYATIGAPSLAGGAAIQVAGSGTADIQDSIIFGHAVGVHRLSGTVDQDYNLFFGNTLPTAGIVNGGTHNASGNPAFINPAGGDYHLGLVSAARDVGVDAGIYIDFDGDARPTGTGFDLGFDEAGPRFLVFVPAVLRQGP